MGHVELSGVGYHLPDGRVLLDEVSFHAPELGGQSITIDAPYVDRMLADIAKSDDLSRYIL